MNTIYGAVTNVLNDLPCDFLYRPAIAARRMDLEVARKKFPGLNDVLLKLTTQTFRVDCSSIAYGCVIDNRQLNADSRFDTCGSTLLLRVPEEFETELEQLAVQEPDAYSLTTTSLIGVLGYCGWSVTKLGTRQRFVINDEVLKIVVKDCRAAANDWHRELPAIVVPVILMTSQALVVGGFWVDAHWDYSLEGGAMSQHYRYYSDEELKAAANKARRVGEMPWRGAWWNIDDSDLTTEVTVFDLRTPWLAPSTTDDDEPIVF